MFHFLADHNFNAKIVKGFLQRTTLAQVVYARDVGLSRTPDPELLVWAVENNCLVLTHDVNTLVGYAYDRVEVAQPTPGVFVAPQTLAVGRAIDDLLLVVECSEPEEWQGQVHYLPLQA